MTQLLSSIFKKDLLLRIIDRHTLYYAPAVCHLDGLRVQSSASPKAAKRLFVALFASITLMMIPTACWSRDPLGVFHDWAAFRDHAPDPKCYVITEPLTSQGRLPPIHKAPYLSIGIWDKPNKKTLYINTGSNIRGSAKPNQAMFWVGQKNFRVRVYGSDAWIADPEREEEVIRALHSVSQAQLDYQYDGVKTKTLLFSAIGFSAAWDIAKTVCDKKGENKN